MGIKVGINGFGRIGRNIMRAAMDRSEPGLNALTAGLEASSRWAVSSRRLDENRAR